MGEWPFEFPESPNVYQGPKFAGNSLIFRRRAIYVAKYHVPSFGIAEPAKMQFDTPPPAVP